MPKEDADLSDIVMKKLQGIGRLAYPIISSADFLH